mmetsp:Transcript_14231/g.25010  ORF Transcript_14231/g.25010 Transcript_14231/m.25010 type:complete len:87 (-) Transcript_14231:928-1188(-)
MAPSETNLQKNLYDLTIESMTQQIQTNDDEMMWKSRLAEIPKRYEKEFIALEAQLQNAQVQEKCLSIPTAVEMVGKACWWSITLMP